MRTRFEVLVVCTANISRSQLAVQLLRHHLTARFGEQGGTIRVTSAGTTALVGERADPDVAKVLATLGRPTVPTDPARQLDPQLIGASDLVLTMTREQRASVIVAVPAAQRRVFTVVELARIARRLVDERRLPVSASPANGLRALVTAAPAWRGPTAPKDPTADDVEDVHGQELGKQVKAGRRIDEALAAIVAAPPTK